MFMDNDNACTMNRLVVALANVVSENNDNMDMFSTAFSQTVENQCPGNAPVTRRIKGFYENTVRNFTDDEYAARFKMKRSTVQVSPMSPLFFL